GGRIAPDVNRTRDLAARLRDGLAGLECIEAGYLLQPGLDQVGRLVQDCGAFRALDARPRAPFEGLVRSLHRCLDLRLACLCVAGHDEAVTGRAAFQDTAVARLDMPAADQQAVGLRRGR